MWFGDFFDTTIGLHVNGKAIPYTCDNAAAREREAYAVQQMYLIQSEATTLRVSYSPRNCEDRT